MKSKTTTRSGVETDPAASKAHINKDVPGWIKPGDQILFEIESGPGDVTKSVWGYVLERRCKDGESFAVVDDAFILNRKSAIRDGDVVKVKHDRIIGIIEGFDFNNKPVIQITMQDGVMINMRRIDGKTSPVVVILDEGDLSTTYEVDHRSHTTLKTE